MSHVAPRSFLLIRFSSLGDVVLQTAIAVYLKTCYPKSKITFLTSSEFSNILEDVEGIDKIISFDRKKLRKFKAYKEFLRKIKNENDIDYIIDLHNNTRTSILKWFFRRVPSFTVSKFNILRRLLVFFKINLFGNYEKTQIERNLAKFKKHLRLKINISDFPLTRLKHSFLTSESTVRGSYIVLAPVASFKEKRWPVEYYRELSELIIFNTDYSVVCLGGPTDDYLDSLLGLRDREPNRFHFLKGKLDLIKTQPYLKHAQVVVGNDSGLNHMAEALGTNVITIFGPTHEDFGFRPHLENSITISEDIWCRPCSTKGNISCFRGKSYCMLNIKPEIVYEKIKTFL